MAIKRSGMALVAANLAPVAGVLFWGWSVFDIVFLYWVENLIIGLVNLLRMAVSRGSVESILASAMRAKRGRPSGLSPQAIPNLPYATTALKFFLIPFFALHYGGFCYGHGTFIFALFSGHGMLARASELGNVDVRALLMDWPMLLAVASLLASHLYSFVANYLGKGEYLHADLRTLMMRPYGRIVALHIAIIAGAMLVTFLGSALPFLLVLVAMKIGVDLKLHALERIKFAALSRRGPGQGANDEKTPATESDKPVTVGSATDPS